MRAKNRKISFRSSVPIYQKKPEPAPKPGRLGQLWEQDGLDRRDVLHYGIPAPAPSPASHQLENLETQASRSAGVIRLEASDSSSRSPDVFADVLVSFESVLNAKQFLVLKAELSSFLEEYRIP